MTTTGNGLLPLRPSARPQKQKGVTLIELMIVVAIIAIIVNYAYPGYQRMVQESRRAEAQAFLLDLMAKQQRYFSEHNRYTTDLENDLGYTPDAENNITTADGNYVVTASDCGDGNIATCVRITATARNQQLADGDLRIDSRNVRQRIEGGNTFDW